MIEFRSKLPKMEFLFHIDHQHTLLCMGSCFAENIAKQLDAHQFSCMSNPFGILYNPISISNGLNLLLGNDSLTSDDLVQQQGLWHSFQHHSRFSGPYKDVVLQNLNQQLSEGQSFLQKTDRLILTLGTAYAYRLKDSSTVVANCHKIPADQFDRHLLSVDECIQALSQMLKQLRESRPKIEVIISVSPIRHLRDGLVQNNRSKATLLLAAAALEQQFSFVHYFPAYEMVIDDLRDYRFYENDLTHPNDQAISYVWNSFQATLFEEKTLEIIKAIGKIIQASKHRPFHPQTKEHQDFLANQLNQITTLKKQYPFLSLEKEETIFRDQLI